MDVILANARLQIESLQSYARVKINVEARWIDISTNSKEKKSEHNKTQRNKI